jgi:type IV pilus assembly protein PilB
MSTRLGELLVKRGLITTRSSTRRSSTDRSGERCAQHRWSSLRVFSDAELTAFLQKEYRLPLVDPAAMEVPPEVVRLCRRTLARRHHLVAISLTGSTLTLAMSDPSNLVAINEVKFLTGYDVEGRGRRHQLGHRRRSPPLRRGRRLQRRARAGRERRRRAGEGRGRRRLKELERATEDAPVVRLVNAILTSAIKRRASDIHLEPYEKMFRVRYRVDGVLEEIMKPPLKLKNAITSRIKVMAQLDIANGGCRRTGASS